MMIKSIKYEDLICLFSKNSSYLWSIFKWYSQRVAEITIVCTIIWIFLKKYENNLFINSVKININWISYEMFFSVQNIIHLNFHVQKKIMINKNIFKNNWSRFFDFIYHEKYPITKSIFYFQKYWISNHDIINFLKIDHKTIIMKLDSYEKKKKQKYRH